MKPLSLPRSGNVIIGPGIVFSPRQLQRRIVIGNMRRTAEHQMLEPVSYTHLDVYKRQLQAIRKVPQLTAAAQ